MKETKKLLLCVFILPIIVAMAIAALYETDTLESGLLSGSAQSEFIWTALMELITLGGVFLALRLFKFENVHRQLLAEKALALRKWGVMRLVLLLLPMVFNTCLYYLYMNTTFGYMAIIGLLCTPFVFPSMSRCQSEVEV